MRSRMMPSLERRSMVGVRLSGFPPLSSPSGRKLNSGRHWSSVIMNRMLGRDSLERAVVATQIATRPVNNDLDRVMFSSKMGCIDLINKYRG